MSEPKLTQTNLLVTRALDRAGVAGSLVVLANTAATAQLAAAALGVEVGAIANSLIFMADGAPLLVMTSGAHRVNTAGLAERAGKTRIMRATPDQVREATGQAIGGVAPVGHPAPVETIVDVALADYAQLWAAGGSAHTVFPLSFDELVRLTGGRVLSVT